MALTLKGNLIGRAASDERRDTAEYLYMLDQQRRRQELIDKENELIDLAAWSDDFYEFWETVPAFGRRGERIALLEDFIASHTYTVAEPPQSVTSSI